MLLEIFIVVIVLFFMLYVFPSASGCAITSLYERFFDGDVDSTISIKSYLIFIKYVIPARNSYPLFMFHVESNSGPFIPKSYKNFNCRFSPAVNLISYYLFNENASRITWISPESVLLNVLVLFE